MAEQPVAPQPNKYRKLPPPFRVKDMRTAQHIRATPTVKGEHDREVEWMLRTTGVFI